MDDRERTDNLKFVLSGQTTEICGNYTGARGEDNSKREVVKRVAEITDLEFNYAGEMELFTVEDEMLGQKEEVASVCWKELFCSWISMRGAGYIQELRWRVRM